ncbi:MAG: hypothetical protein N3I86_02725 [Verrucomicrobiae bacterium]|nr:hypothetical protein [Verrucomicrobiae bacterium]
MSEKTFRDAVCERFGIPPERYAHEVFWRCVFPSTRLPVRLLSRVHPAYFRQDLELIESVADCTSASEVRSELNNFRYYYPIRGFGRRVLHLRISGQRLVELAALVFRD